MPASASTLVRLQRRTALPPPPAPEIIGVDDWSFRKGRTYGALVVDLERHQPIEVLPDKTAETFASWLKAYPTIKVITRDRDSAFAEGAREGASQAVQVADRFHLMVRRITHPSIPNSDGKGSEERLWVNGSPHGESLWGKRACR
jgi:transposase